jgi:3-carboxy-cis,cis-muconate cycloisomerase
MSDLLWPGDERAGDLCTDSAVLFAMVTVEAAWLRALVAHGVAPADAEDDLATLVDARDVDDIARAAEDGGNPVIPLLGLLRKRLATRNEPAARWVHAGLTSQDVLDTALVLCLREAVAAVSSDLSAQIAAAARLADEHRATAMVGRTLTPHAVPITFGLKAAGWLHGLLDAQEQLEAAAGPASSAEPRSTTTLPAQFGGAAGSLAALTTLAGSAQAALDLAATAAGSLGLVVRPPWHTHRGPLTRLADAFVACTDAWGHVAGDVLVAGRPELGELAEPADADRGGSSTMPQKRNPVLSVLIRRAALTAPPLSATLHAAAAAAVDERSDGGWHAEWSTLRTLARHTVTAGSQTAELLAGMRVNADRMAATLAAARPGIDAEQRKIAQLAGPGGGPYLGATDMIIDAALVRARA